MQSLWMVAASLLFACMGVCVKFAAATHSAVEIVFYRSFLSLLLLKAIERRLIDFFARYITPIAQAGYSNPALDKLLAEIGGWADVGLRLRWPSKYLPQAEADRLKPIARAMVPEMFA